MSGQGVSADEFPAPADPDLDKARTRSVDNLQRLYTVVVSLAITESLKRLLIPPPGVTPGYDSWLMFCSLMVTTVPFYHGANRYLDATYVTGERTAKPVALMIDFMALLIEGLALFTLAILVGKAQAFYLGLASLLVFDALWVGFTRLNQEVNGRTNAGYKTWAFVNMLTAAGLYLSFCSNILSFMWEREVFAQIAGLSIVLARTVFDYWYVWKFYYPTRLIPAPLPALLPNVRGPSHL